MKLKFEIKDLNNDKEIIMKGESVDLKSTIENLKLIVENSIKNYEGLETGGHSMGMGNQKVITIVGCYKGIKQYKGFEAVIKYCED